MSGDPASMRRTYARQAFDETELAADWLSQLQGWFDEAVADPAVVEANAVQVATVDAEGRPDVRTVLMKGLDERGLVFFTNYDSAKGAALAAHPVAAAVFSWLPLERQVRLRGTCTRVTRAETEAYFATRPRGSQLGAWASPQSSPVASRAVLDDRLAEVTARFPAEVPPPPDWGGYLLAPDSVEFWQGRPNRLHDRLRFRLVDGTWSVERLAP